MVDDPQAVIAPVTETQDSAMPTENQKAPEPVQDPEVDASVSSENQSEEGLPIDVKERTRQEFDKLKNELREERARREYVEQVYNSLQTKQTEPEQTPIYDPDTGLIDEQVLTDMQRRTQEAERRATQAEASVNSYLDHVEKREVFAKHPDVNPDNKGKGFNENLSKVVSSLLLQSMIKPEEFGNKQLSFMEGVELAKSMINPTKKDVEQEALKEQASIESTGSSGRRTAVESDMVDLQRRTRRGDKDAITERLKRLDTQ